jgi:hypothetical protein
MPISFVSFKTLNLIILTAIKYNIFNPRTIAYLLATSISGCLKFVLTNERTAAQRAPRLNVYFSKMRLLKSDNSPLRPLNSLLFRLQVSVELRLSQCQPPFLALPHQKRVY